MLSNYWFSFVEGHVYLCVGFRKSVLKTSHVSAQKWTFVCCCQARQTLHVIFGLQARCTILFWPASILSKAFTMPFGERLYLEEIISTVIPGNCVLIAKIFLLLYCCVFVLVLGEALRLGLFEVLKCHLSKLFSCHCDYKRVSTRVSKVLPRRHYHISFWLVFKALFCSKLGNTC